LKGLRRSMGDLRDADVTREHLLQWKMPAPVKQVAEELAGTIAADRATLVKAGAAQMHSPGVTRAMVVLARVLKECGKPEAAEQAEGALLAAVTSQIKRREKQLRRAFGKAARKQTPAALHAARIAAKKLRYVMELVAEANADTGAKLKVKFLKQIQALLGDHHDTHVIVERVQAHLQDRREQSFRGLPAAWRKWHGQTQRMQAKRAAEFFAKSYAWMNG
jgi:CHAD domain-containing protein